MASIQSCRLLVYGVEFIQHDDSIIYCHGYVIGCSNVFLHDQCIVRFVMLFHGNSQLYLAELHVHVTFLSCAGPRNLSEQ